MVVFVGSCSAVRKMGKIGSAEQHVFSVAISEKFMPREKNHSIADNTKHTLFEEVERAVPKAVPKCNRSRMHL